MTSVCRISVTRPIGNSNTPDLSGNRFHPEPSGTLAVAHRLPAAAAAEPRRKASATSRPASRSAKIVSKAGAASDARQGLSDAQPILVATDFSPDSDAALLWAARYAEHFEAPLIVLHVVHDPADASGFYVSGDAEALEPMSEVAEKMIAAFMSRMRDANPDLAPLHSARSELVAGLPPGRIVEVAEGEDACMIVIGSRGRTGLTDILMGSVAKSVAQRAPMPVVIVKRQTEG